MTSSDYLYWLKSHLIRSDGKVNLATSGIITSKASEWYASVATNGGQEVAQRLGESNEFGLSTLHRAIRDAWQVPTEVEIVSTEGGTGAILQFFLASLSGIVGSEVIVESPSYEPLRRIPEKLGAKIRHFRRDCFPESVLEQASSKTSTVVISNPHNPSGIVSSPDSIFQLAERLAWIAPNCAILVDEVYNDIGPYSGRTVAGLHPRIVTVGSLSKSHGLAPLRCGWLLLDRDMFPNIWQEWSLFRGIGPKLNEVHAAMAIESITDFRAAAQSHLATNRKLMSKWLVDTAEKGIIEPLQLQEGCVAFPKISGCANSDSLVARLESNQGVLVVPGKFFGAHDSDGHIRIGFGGPTDQLTDGLARLSSGLTRLSGA